MRFRALRGSRAVHRVAWAMLVSPLIRYRLNSWLKDSTTAGSVPFETRIVSAHRFGLQVLNHQPEDRPNRHKHRHGGKNSFHGMCNLRRDVEISRSALVASSSLDERQSGTVMLSKANGRFS